jgi:SMODS-associated and fused to various effectors sensor domain
VDWEPPQNPGRFTHPGRYARAVRLHPDPRELIDPEDAAALIAELSQQIRASAGQAATHRVHLFPRIPFPIAVLLGRTLNTLEVTLYEWDDTGATPRYAETVTVASGRGGGPIVPR